MNSLPRNGGEIAANEEIVWRALKHTWPLDLDLSAEPLALNDIWVEPGYSGAVIRCRRSGSRRRRRSRIGGGAQSAEELEFTAEARLSRLGNHYLRVKAKKGLDKADLNEVNQALRRGTRGMGPEKLESTDRTWPTFRAYAKDIINEIAKALGTKPVDEKVSFHVVLGARSISEKWPSGAHRPLRSKR